MQVTIQFNATLPVKISKRGSLFVASCPILDVHSQGDTEAQARDNLGEALSLFFISCFERGVLDDVLRACGFRASSAIHPDPQAKPEYDYINVPIPFLVNQEEHQCHA